ncbi:hypothetical protein G7Y89_g10144 [Cudoniella acicularis]|uniref:DUF7896 domain-containing protein n=1 Tax=Cudoniella acicularis TaxID=354080 RepID=A0A8H4RFL6_9HELO|nr:hypothetical protein G7Y89_g10144 [Cudoniella acicularis]
MATTLPDFTSSKQQQQVLPDANHSAQLPPHLCTPHLPTVAQYSIAAQDSLPDNARGAGVPSPDCQASTSISHLITALETPVANHRQLQRSWKTTVPSRYSFIIETLEQLGNSTSLTFPPRYLPIMSDLRINTTIDLGQQRLQQLLAIKDEINAQNAAQNADIEAEILALLPPSSVPSTSYQNHRSPIHKHHHRRSVNNVPRSMSSSGATMARQLSDRIETPSQRRTLSQRSAPQMARNNSRGTSSARSGPFVQTGAIPPPPLRSEPLENPAIDWMMKDQPLTSYTFSHQPTQLERSPSQRHELEQVPELDHALEDLEDPLNYIARTAMGTPTLEISPPFSTPSTMNSGLLSTGSFNIATPTTPTTDTLTSATTFTMSRQSSNEPVFQNSMFRQDSLNEPVCKGLQMMKVNSSNSYSNVDSSDQIMYDQVTPHFTSHHNRRCSSEEQSQLLVGAGGASHDSQFPHSFSSADAFASTGFGEKMEKSQSSESTSSTSSSSSRNKQRLQATLAAARPLKPKGGSDENAMSRANSSQSMARLESKDGSQDKVAISKPTYQRPKHDRVFCKQCESHPDGFRGEHELRRHQDREHKPLVKKWVCIEPTGHGHPKPELPLSKCKACGPQQKKYGAYYNAAAHLRRTHFKPKAKGRNKSTKVDDIEKRGGKGGGDWPPMSELKYWMKEVEEPATEYATSTTQEEVDESEDESLDTKPDEQFYSQPMSAVVVPSNYDSAFLAETSPILNMYPTTTNNMYDMQSIPLDMSEQSSFVDQSMYGQSSFPNFSSSYSNDPMAFFDSSILPTQNFDDHVLTGPEYVVNSSYQ